MKFVNLQDSAIEAAIRALGLRVSGLGFRFRASGLGLKVWPFNSSTRSYMILAPSHKGPQQVYVVLQ